jgi:HTH-type transcriptional regulator/antitoxin HigA
MSTLKPAEVFPPGEFIQDELDARGWDADDLVGYSGINAVTIHAILEGRGKITQRRAEKLGYAFGTSASLWTNLQRTWDERQEK